MDADGVAVFVPNLKSISLQHPRDRDRSGQLDHIGQPQIGRPFAIVSHLDLFRRHIQNFTGLVEITLGILLNLIGGQYRAGGILAGRIADTGGIVADNQDGFVA